MAKLECTKKPIPRYTTQNKKWQNIFRYQLHVETPGIPGHIHGDPDNADIMGITSYELDLSNGFKTPGIFLLEKKNDVTAP